ncbi:MAG: FCD domain-containing protein, partial [Thermoguttaceae bacterium]|nr:FCD domain-containing protein [Thermoguttaceae bacterium]
MAGKPNDSLAPMRAVMELRGVIDGFAARKAAERIAEDTGKRALLDAFARFGRAVERGCYPGALKADRQLHLAIVRVAAVEALEPAWETVANTREWFHVPARNVGSL